MKTKTRRGERAKHGERRGQSGGMVVMSCRLPPGMSLGPPRRRRPLDGPEREWTAAERASLEALERDIERGWVASESGMRAQTAARHPWLDAWRGLLRLVTAEGGPGFDDVARRSETVETFVEAFTGQLGIALRAPAGEASAVWAEWLLEVTAGLLGPLERWFTAQRSEHRRLHVAALTRLGRGRDAAIFVERWRAEAPGDVAAWLATSRLHCDPAAGVEAPSEEADAACRVLERALRHCADPFGRALLWAELHAVYGCGGRGIPAGAVVEELGRILH